MPPPPGGKAASTGLTPSGAWAQAVLPDEPGVMFRLQLCLPSSPSALTLRIHLALLFAGSVTDRSYFTNRETWPQIRDLPTLSQLVSQRWGWGLTHHCAPGLPCAQTCSEVLTVGPGPSPALNRDATPTLLGERHQVQPRKGRGPRRGSGL